MEEVSYLFVWALLIHMFGQNCNYIIPSDVLIGNKVYSPAIYDIGHRKRK